MGNIHYCYSNKHTLHNILRCYFWVGDNKRLHRTGSNLCTNNLRNYFCGYSDDYMVGGAYSSRVWVLQKCRKQSASHHFPHRNRGVHHVLLLLPCSCDIRTDLVRCLSPFSPTGYRCQKFHYPRCPERRSYSVETTFYDHGSLLLHDIHLLIFLGRKYIHIVVSVVCFFANIFMLLIVLILRPRYRGYLGYRRFSRPKRRGLWYSVRML